MYTKVVGYWDKKKAKLKQKFPILNDDDLHFQEGKEREMMEMIGQKLGKTKQELLYIIVAL